MIVRTYEKIYRFIKHEEPLTVQFLLTISYCLLVAVIIKLIAKYVGTRSPKFKLSRVFKILLQHLNIIFVFILLLNIANLSQFSPHKFANLLRTLLILSTCYQFSIWSIHFINAWGLNATHAESISLFRTITKVFSVLIILLIGLDNLGVDIAALLAGLGLGGVALAFTAKSFLTDLFASISILLDKPFIPGDRIQIDDSIGVVESIGIKSTRLRSTTGEQIIIPNQILIDKKLSNFEQMTERRCTLRVQVDLDTQLKNANNVTNIIKDCVCATEGVRFVHANLVALTPVSLDFEVTFFVLSKNNQTFMATQGNVLRDILESFKQNNILLPTAHKKILLANHHENSY